MKKSVYIIGVAMIVAIGGVAIHKEEQLQESKRLVLDLQDTIRMMDKEINEAYNRIEELEQERPLVPDGYGTCY